MLIFLIPFIVTEAVLPFIESPITVKVTMKLNQGRHSY